MHYSDVTIDPSCFIKQWPIDHEQMLLSRRAGGGFVLNGPEKTLNLGLQDFARAAWLIHKHGVVFYRKFKIRSRYWNDIGGAGSQLIHLMRSDVRKDEDYFLSVGYVKSYREEEWIYEADLITDQSKDYLPTVNRGRSKFIGDVVRIDTRNKDELLTWLNNEYIVWVREFERLDKPHSTLSEWTESGLDMLVQCSIGLCNNKYNTIPTEKLKEYHASGLTLEILQERLSCSKCGRRLPRIAPA